VEMNWSVRKVQQVLGTGVRKVQNLVNVSDENGPNSFKGGPSTRMVKVGGKVFSLWGG
jgi:hypothetical protein